MIHPTPPSTHDGILSMTFPIFPRYRIPDANSQKDTYIPPESLRVVHNPNPNPNPNLELR